MPFYDPPDPKRAYLKLNNNYLIYLQA